MTELIRLLFVSDTFILRVSINLCLNEDVIERLFVAVFEHLLKLFTVVVCAGGSAVDIGADNNDAVAFGVFHTDMNLSVDGLFRLPVT